MRIAHIELTTVSANKGNKRRAIQVKQVEPTAGNYAAAACVEQDSTTKNLQRANSAQTFVSAVSSHQQASLDYCKPKKPDSLVLATTTYKQLPRNVFHLSFRKLVKQGFLPRALLVAVVVYLSSCRSSRQLYATIPA